MRFATPGGPKSGKLVYVFFYAVFALFWDSFLNLFATDLMYVFEVRFGSTPDLFLCDFGVIMGSILTTVRDFFLRCWKP